MQYFGENRSLCYLCEPITLVFLKQKPALASIFWLPHKICTTTMLLIVLEELQKKIEKAFWERLKDFENITLSWNKYLVKKWSTYINSLCQSTEVWPPKEEYFETCCHLYVNEINLFFTCKSILVSFSNNIVTKNIARYFLYNMYYTNSILA